MNRKHFGWIGNFVAAGLACTLVACGGSDGSSSPGDEAAGTSPGPMSWLPEGATAIRSESIAKLEGTFGAVEFLARPGFSDDEPRTVVDLFSVGERDNILLAALNRDGATPLEIFRVAAPDAEPPEVLVENHRDVTKLLGRESEVRAYSNLAPIDLPIWPMAAGWCTELDFPTYVSGGFSSDVTVVATTGGNNPTGYITHTIAQARHAPITQYSCSRRPNGSCSSNGARRVTMWACSNGNCGYQEDMVAPCEYARLSRLALNAGATFGVMSERVANINSATGVNLIRH